MAFLRVQLSGARGPPQFSKKRSENAGANENLSFGSPSIPGLAPGVAPRIVVFVLLKSWNFVFREWNFEFRELLREYPGTLREIRGWPFHSESVFPEIGGVPRLLKMIAAMFHPRGRRGMRAEPALGLLEPWLCLCLCVCA